MPVTRSASGLLQVIDGLNHLDQTVIDLASKFFAELRSVTATYGDESIEKLIPHITVLMSALNDSCKVNGDFQQEIDSLRENLTLAENRCLDLNNSFKVRNLECCELEDNHEAQTQELNTHLARYKEENTRLKAALNRDADAEVRRVLAESEEKITALTNERRCLLTTVEVLESEVKCLRAELRAAESRARQRRSSIQDFPSLLDLSFSSPPAQPTPAPQPTATSQPTVISQATQTQLPPKTTTVPSTPLTTKRLSTNNVKDFKQVLIIGDSHLKYSSLKCSEKGAFIECIPGGKILDIRNVLVSYVGVSLSVIYIHVGCNNLKWGFKGRLGYNGGHGKREALHDMAELLFTARTQFPNSTVVLNSVLTRRDIGYRALHGFNSQLDLMCNNFGVRFVEANTCVSKQDLTRDGVHFSRNAVSRLGSLLVDVTTEVLQSKDATAARDCVVDEVLPTPGLDSESAGILSDDHDPCVSPDGPRDSEN